MEPGRSGCYRTATYASPESNPGRTHSGGADDGDGSACERTRIARRHGTDGAVNEGHHRGAGTASGAAARVGDAQAVKLGHRAVLGGQRAIESVVLKVPYASPEPNPGAQRRKERGASATGRRGCTDGVVNECHRGDGTVPGTAMHRRRTGREGRSSCCAQKAADQ